MERRRINFAGRVQGVGFRATARHIASSCLVSGWVRNEPDGSVMMEVQGQRAEIERYLALLRSRMQGLIRAENGAAISPQPDESSFEIVR